jgi:anti-sigma factor RsiW
MNSRNEHMEWTDRFSDYLDGELAAEEHAAVEQHLAECGACRRTLEELGDVIARAKALGPLEPTRDLWGGIAATIQAPASRVDGARVIALPVGRNDAALQRNEDGRSPRVRRWAFSLPQLAAAALVLIATSSLATWAAGPGVGAGPSSVPVGADDVTPVTTEGVSMASSNAAAPAAMASELARLEATLQAAEATLDPNTVRILERNLAVIERAIADSRSALEQDPGNAFLSEHLERVFERKLTYLREAAQVVEWTG